MISFSITAGTGKAAFFMYWLGVWILQPDEQDIYCNVQHVRPATNPFKHN
jgi:hypothetical protein